jgi:co-chaperonin GroES (HSP10)
MERSSVLIDPKPKAVAHLVEVTAVGPEISDIRFGQTVVVGTHGGVTVKITDDEDRPQEYLVIHEDNVLAVWEGD